MSQIKLGVIGAGIMGSNHFRAAGRNVNVELVAVCDSDIEKIEQLAFDTNVAVLVDPKEMISLVDAVIIATPTDTHYLLAKLFLESNIPVLVEKPISTTVEEGQELIDLAESKGIPFLVGHIERFNSAVAALPKLIKDPFHFEFRRISPFSGRVKESIVSDLMIHDLELMCHLNPHNILNIQAIAQKSKSNWDDFASVLISFDNGSTAMLTASRVGQQKIRSIEISQKDSVIHADLLKSDILISRVDHVEYTNEGGSSFRQHGVMEIPFIERYGEPLIIEQQEFVRAITETAPSPIDPRTALRALELAHKIEDVVSARATANV